ncbi:MAG: radical SAM protein [Bacteroidales bacterium]|nr:radical SAM protein [Bacteroidales bacterium]
MQRVLFHSTIFGPIHSRRLGTSLGINLGPNDGKVCTFDCLYCEAGYNAQGPGTTGLPTPEQVAEQLDAKLKEMHAAGKQLDVITFSGNGEPTAHPRFEEIVDRVIALRDRDFPEAKVSVLCNSTRLGDEGVCRALRKVDNNILKLDSAVDKTMRLIDRPGSRAFNCEWVIDRIATFGNDCIVQTMLLRGEDDEGNVIDNTTDAEVDALIAAYQKIQPKEVMLYSIDRATPARRLSKVEREDLERVAEQIRAAGIKVQVN